MKFSSAVLCVCLGAASILLFGPQAVEAQPPPPGLPVDSSEANTGDLGNGVATGTNSIAISRTGGDQAVSDGLRSIAIGFGAQAMTGPKNTAVGDRAEARTGFSAAYGTTARATGDSSIAIGRNPLASMTNTIAVGRGAQATGTNAITIGWSSEASGQDSTAIGRDAEATQVDAAAFGREASARSQQSTAIGSSTEAAERATALGFSANAAGNSAVAIGKSSSATEDNSVAIGPSALASGLNSVAIGRGASTTQLNAMVLGGDGSTTDKPALNVGIGTNNPSAEASLELDGNRGLILNRVTNPGFGQKGMILFEDGGDQQVQFYDGSNWEPIGEQTLSLSSDTLTLSEVNKATVKNTVDLNPYTCGACQEQVTIQASAVGKCGESSSGSRRMRGLNTLFKVTECKATVTYGWDATGGVASLYDAKLLGLTAVLNEPLESGTVTVKVFENDATSGIELELMSGQQSEVQLAGSPIFIMAGDIIKFSVTYYNTDPRNAVSLSAVLDTNNAP